MSQENYKKDPRELGIFRFFARQDVFINILYGGIFIFGLILWCFIMNREAFGNFDFDLVTITTPYKGAVAEEVEQLVTQPIENAIKPLEGIEEMNSVSVEGLSVITVQLDPDNGNKQKVVRSIEREVDRVRTIDLPDDGDEPLVLEITAAFPVLTVGIYGLPEMALRDAADDLEENFMDIDGVSRVSKNGYKNKEIWVEANVEKLRQNNLSLIDLVTSIRNADHTSPGGRLEVGGQEIIVRTIGKLENVEEIEKAVVRANEEGQTLIVKDLATVTERLERERKKIRLNGQESIELNILKKDSGDTLEIDKAIKEVLSKYKRDINPKLEYAFANEISFYINRRLSVLIKNGFVGIVLVLFIMFLFLSPQSAFWSTSAIPFAFLGGLVTMFIFGVTINLLSLFAFILVSGMLVDNGIVVAEYIERKRAEGIPTFTAVVVGVSEMSLPVFAAALTTIIAFAPLAFMSGITGKFLRQMPIVLIACLVSDLLECLFILPGHLYHYDWKFKIPKFAQKMRTRAQDLLKKLSEFYRRILEFIISKSMVSMMIFAPSVLILMFISIFIVVKNFKMFPSVIDLFNVKFEMPVGATLGETEQIAKGFENILQKLPNDQLEGIVTQVGSHGEGGHSQSRSGTNIGQIMVYLNKAHPNRIPGRKLISQISDEVVAYAKENDLPKFELEKVQGGPPIGRAIEVKLIGDDFVELKKLSLEVQHYLRSMNGTIGIVDDFDQGKNEYRLIIDRDAVARTGLTISQVAMVVRAAYDGQEAIELKRAGETQDISVKVKLTEEDRTTPKTLDRLTISNPRGRQIPLSKLVKIEKSRGVLTILRTDGDRTITVKGDIDEDITTSNKVNKKLEKYLKGTLSKYPGVKYKFSGEKKNQQESIHSLISAILISLGLIYLVLATLFRSYWVPVVIISIVPFAFIGISLSLFFSFKPITLLVMIGFAGLTGVVVNNSILMLETYIRLQDQEKKSKEDAVLFGSLERLRPILLTSLSTFFGVMPLGLGLGGTEPFLQDMAYSFGWGLLFCSLMTLLWVPLFYISTHKVSTFLIKK